LPRLITGHTSRWQMFPFNSEFFLYMSDLLGQWEQKLFREDLVMGVVENCALTCEGFIQGAHLKGPHSW
jgi:hypothetical protein